MACLVLVVSGRRIARSSGHDWSHGPPHMELMAVTIDCSDTERLADFCTGLTGGEMAYSDADYG